MHVPEILDNEPEPTWRDTVFTDLATAGIYGLIVSGAILMLPLWGGML